MKHDLRKEMPHFFEAPKGRFEEVTLPPARYFAVDGFGNPNTSPAYRAAVEALYRASYKLKFLSKAAGADYTVPPLEGLWWAEDPAVFAARNKDHWSWQMLILIPPFVGEALAEKAVAACVAATPDAEGCLRTVTLAEGTVIQTLHVGSYDDETPVLDKLHHEVMPAGNWTFNGHHHEVYLSDPRRTAPQRLKTILRQPVKKAG
ncbi:GyrI-like domain-containing protein [Gellertiella hungarica]|uniref:GyrI-like small molecule binding domain-containing protein n=1 Tax=Gellertiella hungarica TaxID=1572859 RepID=A0A7W6J4F3_9HYPH|nr:GyrI-like domain-containing protein [Gellertiella hungarica]MBB4064619.1 hypothetical protein [Gellertiella hungarica]